MRDRAADALWQRLTEGNSRFREGRSTLSSETGARLDGLAAGQSPFAAVIACADSRVGPEIVFDAPLGDLFVMRVAGGLAGPTVVGSLAYAAEHLGVGLVVVLGARFR